MTTSWPLTRLLHNLSEENYERSFSAYCFWIGLGAAYRGTSNHQLYNDILSNTKPDLIKIPLKIAVESSLFGRGIAEPRDSMSGQLIHTTVHLLLRFITDAEVDPALANDAAGLHGRLCRESLKQFFRQSLDYISEGRTGPTSKQLCEFYTRVNLIAHWINLGYAKLEDVQDHILQSLVLQPVVFDHHLNSLIILLKISGATFAAYVDPSLMDRCCDLLKPDNLEDRMVLTGLAEEILRLRKSGWKGLPPPPVLQSGKPVTIPRSQDPAATPVATSLGLPGAGDQSQPPALPSPAPEIPSEESPNSSLPPSPSSSVAAFSDFTMPDILEDEAIVEPETITPHDMFYLDDGSVEVVCGKTLFRVHVGTLSFHSPALRQIFSPANLTATESPNGCPRIVSSDTPTDFSTLLKVIYLPEFPDRSKVPDFSTFSSLLRVSTKYEMSNLRARLLETIRGAYPETFEGLDPSKALGENVFDAPKPHPNAVLNFFVQQKVTSALPMAYYMAVQRGLDSLMDTRLPSSATLSGQTLRSAMRGLMALREMELKETHRIVFAINTNRAVCSSTDCPSRSLRGPSDAGTVEAHQRAFDRMIGSIAGGTRILQVLSASEFEEDPESKFCRVCVEKMQVAHAEVRKKAWAALPEVFGLKT